MERRRCGEPIVHYETERIRKDGRRIEVSLTISPIRDGAGMVTGAALIVRDITERKRIEACLRESEQRFRNLSDTAPVMIWVYGRSRGLSSFARHSVRIQEDAQMARGSEARQRWQSSSRPEGSFHGASLAVGTLILKQEKNRATIFTALALTAKGTVLKQAQIREPTL